VASVRARSIKASFISVGFIFECSAAREPKLAA
jgi:hypothetical protein